jgi:DNA excision repair protein ERCC-3
MEAVGGETLIIVPNRELAQQWEDELTEKTTLASRQIGQYHGGEKRIRPVTIATYDTAAMSRHRELFNERDWGLVIADECHHSVASTWKRFREIQSKARLGLSATPVREADDPKEIYTLIGPPIGTDWGSLFAEGWVEKPEVELIPVPWASDSARERYQRASGSKRLIEAARNPKKHDVVDALLDRHSDKKTLIFVDWIKQGKDLAEDLDLPFVYGETDHDERERIYDAFRDGELDALIISRVGDEGIDLPDAEVAILASTMGSSRSQTGQRAGRTMRPLGDATVYIVLTKGSGEEDWGRESTQYLAEKGVDVTKTSLSQLEADG